MGLSLVSSQGLFLSQSHGSGDYKRFAREALKAFKKVKFNGKPFYTCNVARLHECRRLGPEKEVGLWFSHFFQCSPHFDEVFGAIFSQGPGEELASFTRAAQLKVYIAIGAREVIDPTNGLRIATNEPLQFASTK